MKVFLTGGTGFIGGPLVKALRLRGWNLIALVRDPKSPQALALSRAGIQLAAGDITDRESLRAAMSSVDMVVHNAGHYAYGLNKTGRERMTTINVLGTDNVLGLAHELNIPRTLYVSSVQAFGETGAEPRDESFIRQSLCRTAYERSKTAAHGIALHHQQQGLPLIIVCPNAAIGKNDYSSWGYFLRMYLNRCMPPLGWAPKTIHCCVGVNDLAEGIALAAEKGRAGETYILSGEARPFREHLNYWVRRPGAFKPSIWLPANLALLFFAPLEPLLRLLGLPAFLSRETVIGGATNWHYTSEKAKRELGWTVGSAEELWLATLDGELETLPGRKGQYLLQRLKPLDGID